MTTATTQPAAQYALTAAAAARAAQLAVRAGVMRDTARLWPLLDPKRLAETFPGWLLAMTKIVTGYHRQSSTAAAAFYRAARATATGSSTPSNLIRFAAPPPDEWMAKAFGYSGPGTLSRDTARPGTALSTTLGTAARVALEGGRATILDTVQHDPDAVGWYRVTDGHPCAFCALLAGRGIVYKQDTVDFKAHNDCGCTGAPAFSHGQELPAISRTAAQVYAERGPGNSLVAFRKAWADHVAATENAAPPK